VACSNGDTVNSGDSGQPTPVTACGELDVVSAAALAATRLEHFGTVGLAALSGLEGSRAAARLLRFGDDEILDPFVVDAQSSVHDGLVAFRDEHLIASNVESTTDSSVTYLLAAETLCKEDEDESGNTSTQLDPDCVQERREHPLRVRISRIACDAGDNLAVEVFRDAARERLALAELYADRAELEIDVGAYLRATSHRSTEWSDDSEVPTVKVEPLVSSATGTLRGTLTLNGADQAAGKLSVRSPIDVTFSDSDFRVRIAAGTEVATIEADGAARTVKLVAALGASDWRARFVDFVDGLFNLETTEAGDAQSPVDVHVAGLRGSLDFDGKADMIAVKNLDLGGELAKATQGTNTLLQLDFGNAEHKPVNATLTGKTNDALGLKFLDGLGLQITYGAGPVMSWLVAPANYLAKDVLEISVAPNSNLLLLPEEEDDNLVLSSGQTGALLYLESGTMTMESQEWPADGVSVQSGQCLTRTPQSQPGHHELLDDMIVGACGQ
jgi:hypothetical protein